MRWTVHNMFRAFGNVGSALVNNPGTRFSSSHSENTNKFVQEAFKVLSYPANLNQLLLTPQREICVEMVITRDNGNPQSFLGYRVQHDDSRGPFKGGLRFHPQVDLDDVRSLASLMTWKTSLLDIPFGGAKGGVTCQPRELSERELEKLTRKFVQKIKEVMGPYKDIPAPDVNTDERHMAWMFDEFSKFEGFSPACVTGKPTWLHGSLGRESATGRGATIAIRQMLKAFGEGGIAGKTFCIQGFGNVGSWAARFIAEEGGIVKAVSDVNGACINPKGLDVVRLRQHLQKGGTVTNFPNGQAELGSEIFNVPCDVFVPAALGGVIDENTARKLPCRYVVEAANGPTTPAGDLVLRDRGIEVLPDIYTNAGGVTVSFFEWVQNLGFQRWTEDEVNQRLEAKMVEAFDALWEIKKSKDLPMRTAAFVKSIQRVARASLHRGFD